MELKPLGDQAVLAYLPDEATAVRFAAAVRAAFASAATSGRTDATLLIADAETDADLTRLVAVASDVVPGFFAGTAGLANALAASAPARPRRDIAKTSRGTLVAVGTLAGVSRQAACRLAAREGVGVLRVPSGSCGDSAAGAQATVDAAARLRRGERAGALLDGRDGTGAQPDAGHAEAFAHALVDEPHEMGALVATGGETAAALLARCGVHGLEIVGEIEPGIALGLTRGLVTVPVVTKPGAFGDEGSLIRCVDALAALERTS